MKQVFNFFGYIAVTFMGVFAVLMMLCAFVTVQQALSHKLPVAKVKHISFDYTQPTTYTQADFEVINTAE